MSRSSTAVWNVTSQIATCQTSQFCPLWIEPYLMKQHPIFSDTFLFSGMH
jgi:hypothetical protein